MSHSHPQWPCSFWSAPRIATSVRVQHQKSANHGLPITLHMLRVKSDETNWLRVQKILCACSENQARPLGTKMTRK